MDARWREALVFEVEGRRFGLPASEIQELVRAVALTPPPLGSTLVEGVFNLRGAIVPVFDLRARLGLPPRSVEPSESLVIVRRGGRPMAIRVDRPLELATLGVDDVDPAQLVEDVGAADRSAGVAKLVDGFAVLLDLDTLLRPAEAGTGGADRP
jgi:purine-binding chemotaxis protein CheW